MACKWVRLACERHLRDLEHGHERGLSWDADAVEDERLFFASLRHSKGEWAGQPIALESWQLFIVGSIFGWKLADGRRRFRWGYIAVPKKNGKSTLAAGVGIRLAFFDDEPGAEAYAAATKRDQAKIVWSEAKRMVLRSPALRERITPLTANLHDHATASKFEPLGADADSTEGINPSAAIVDELHAHKTRAMWDVLETATGARRQPLIFAITTAGFNRAGVCYELQVYIMKVLEGTITNDQAFGIIYTIDEGDDPHAPSSWAKANPNYGVSVKQEALEELSRKARDMPSALSAYLTKRLNVWVNADVAEVDMVRWAKAAGPIRLEDLRDVPCWIGVDLASKDDLAAVVAVFAKDGHVWILPRFYLPSALVHDAGHAATAHYEGWATAGHLTLTEGNQIDFTVIKRDLEDLARHVMTCREIDFDPYNATHLEQELAPLAQELGLEIVEIPQNVKNLSGPTKAVRGLLKDGKFHHDGNQVMSWCASNVVSREDANGNVFPRKAARNLKIDGYRAMLNALNRALVNLDAASVYETRGVIAV